MLGLIALNHHFRNHHDSITEEIDRASLVLYHQGLPMHLIISFRQCFKHQLKTLAKLDSGCESNELSPLSILSKDIFNQLKMNGASSYFGPSFSNLSFSNIDIY